MVKGGAYLAKVRHVEIVDPRTSREILSRCFWSFLEMLASEIDD